MVSYSSFILEDFKMSTVAGFSGEWEMQMIPLSLAKTSGSKSPHDYATTHIYIHLYNIVN